MGTIVATAQCGIIVRQDSLRDKRVSYESLLGTMEVDSPLDKNEQLVSFGPCFGEDAMYEFVRRLEALGLSDVSDFVAVSFDLPSWCVFHVALGE